MTEVKYKCGQHGMQPVIEIILPENTYILDCGCIYSANYHGSSYRIKTSCCDKCGFIIKGTCLLVSNYTAEFYHIECAKDLGIIDKGKIIDIDEYPDWKHSD